MKHTVSINVADKCGNNTEVLKTRKIRLPKRILNFLFGEFSDVLIFTPGKTVVGVEIAEKTMRGDHLE